MIREYNYGYGRMDSRMNLFDKYDLPELLKKQSKGKQLTQAEKNKVLLYASSQRIKNLKKKR